MFTATLIAKTLEPQLVSNLQSGWGGGAITWLAPRKVAEFRLPEQPANLWQVWSDLQDMQVDLVVQPTQGRRKKMLLADMDSTMIEQECIDELADAAGFGPRVAEITARAMNGELDFEDALRERVGLLKGLPIETIEQVYQSRITLMAGGKTLLATMKANGGHAALVSGGFTDFTSRVAQVLGFDENRANTLINDGTQLTGEVGTPILGRDAKVQALDEITTRLGITPADVIAVGDGANDLGMLQAAGTGVALHAKPTVQEQVSVRVNHNDLTALLYIQGYAEDDFAC